ncbi:P-loop containing nucleoside triphosphate hydrolase protein, partial [Basidiobolus meristosporus CBS 931.73]
MPYDSVRESLPIYQYREELIEAIQENNLLVIIGETGSGKTTQIPQYVLEGIPNIKRTAITQPRRIAAITVAKRVAQEHGTKLGKTVGYTIRFEDCTTPETQLRYMTDGVLLREACGDPELKNYDMIIIDEAHERTVETDVLFGLLKKTHQLRPELKIIVMSATLNVEKFSDFFDSCPIFSIPGRTYDVDILHHHDAKMASLKSTYVARAVNTALHIHEREPPGDILVFLTGQGEIEKACKDFKEKAREIDPRDIEYGDEIRRLEVYPIYASLETFEQKAVFERTPRGVRKVIFATNIAQTSVTIPGISRYVVDSGFVKQKSYDSQTGMDALLVVPISQAAATQRAGRAGRTQEGKAYRLYSRSAFEKLEADTIPEIQRSSLISTILGLKKIGIKNVVDFEFVDPPDSSLVRNALRQLYYLGAIDDYGRLTQLGDEMNSFPLSPFLSRALIASARQYQCSKEILVIASMLSVEEVFLSPRGEKKQAEAEEARKQFFHRSGDHLTLYNIYMAWRETGYSKSWCHENYLRYRSLSMARNIRDQLIQIMEK